MCPRTKLKVISKFSLNGELLCGAWLLKSFQQREGQRILSYSRNSVEIEAQKASLERRTSSDLGSPVLDGKQLKRIFNEITTNIVTFFIFTGLDACIFFCRVLNLNVVFFSNSQ